MTDKEKTNQKWKFIALGLRPRAINFPLSISKSPESPFYIYYIQLTVCISQYTIYGMHFKV